MQWVIWARPNVDRIACAWRIKRLVDQEAEFLYVPAEEVRRVAASMVCDAPHACCQQSFAEAC